LEDISAFGVTVTLTASNTYPVGLTLTHFADDADPLDIPEITIKDGAMGVNGDLVTWSKATKIDIKIAVIPGSIDDIALSILAEANRVGLGKSSAQDIITCTGVYPNGATVNLTEGSVMTFMPGYSIASVGKLKSKVYGFMFENVTNTVPV
jgi:hypothetical protein